MPQKTQPKRPITGEDRVVTAGFRDRVYRKVQQVPRGAVSTYGDVGGALGSRRVARQVGFALSALDKTRALTVPWQRIINASGRISFKGDLSRADLQRRLLESEGISFDDEGKVLDFERVRHAFRAPRVASKPRAKKKKKP